VHRVPIVGLGCAGAIPSLRCASDFVRSHLGSVALVVTVEICSACYYADGTLETVVGNAICAYGAAAFLLTSRPLPPHLLVCSWRLLSPPQQPPSFPPTGPSRSPRLNGTFPM
jgi:predicted naringenin-chalcone synthase